MDEKRILLRHTLATLAYRATRSLENAPAEFAVFDGAGRRPVAILAHVGQLAMLRRLAGCPILGENFYIASIAVGQTGMEQPAPLKTF
jgi:hypothetical protein